MVWLITQLTVWLSSKIVICILIRTRVKAARLVVIMATTSSSKTISPATSIRRKAIWISSGTLSYICLRRRRCACRFARANGKGRYVISVQELLTQKKTMKFCKLNRFSPCWECCNNILEFQTQPAKDINIKVNSRERTSSHDKFITKCLYMLEGSGNSVIILL